MTKHQHPRLTADKLKAGEYATCVRGQQRGLRARILAVYTDHKGLARYDVQWPDGKRGGGWSDWDFCYSQSEIQEQMRNAR